MFHRPNNQQTLRRRLAEMSQSNQLLTQQLNQLYQHLHLAFEESRTLRREVVELTRDINSILHEHINSQQRCLILQQDLANKDSRISQLEGHMLRLQEKITLLESQLARSISHTQIISQNPMATSNNTSENSSSTSAPNNR